MVNDINNKEELPYNKTWVMYEDVQDVTPEEFFKGSQLSVGPFKNKYLQEGETTPAQVFWRVAQYAASKEGTKSEMDYWSRRWFHELWGGVWMAGGSILQGAASKRSISLCNCTTHNVEGDNLEAIFDVGYKIAKTAAYRQGLGVIVDLRPKGAAIHNSANTSDGNIHWLSYYNNIGNFVGQKGRIPAMLFALKDTNPDLMDFITAKSDQNSIPNANISIQFSDAFMKCLEKDGVWTMRYTVEDTGETIEKVEKASVIFDRFVENNYYFAEPGAQFIDTARRMSNSDYLGNPDFGIIGTNACSEQFLEAKKGKSSGVCFLSSVNFMSLYRMYGNNLGLACEALRKDVAPSILRFIDNLIDKELEDNRSPIMEQRISLEQLRRAGVGITNCDGYLIYNNIGYDTDEGIETIFKLMDSLNVGLYETSIQLGKERGSFKAFDKEKYCQAPFVKQMIERHGLNIEAMRNVCVSSIAPTGTISSMLPDRVSYGIEPTMGLYYWKRHRTSGEWKWTFVVPQFVQEILAKKGVDLGMNGADSIEENEEGTLGEAIASKIKKHFPEGSFKPAHLIDPYQKIKLMSMLTKYCVDSAISVTYNLPEDVSKDTIKKIYQDAWKEGVKGIAIYRDKCREGVVEFEPPYIASKRYTKQPEEQKSDKPENKLAWLGGAIKRPASLMCEVHHVKVRGEKWVAFIGVYDGKPYEIFAGKEEEVCIPLKYKKGDLVKDKKKYFFISGDVEEDTIKVNVTGSFKNDEHSALTRQISLSLRHGVPLVFVIQQLDKSTGTITEYSKVLMRVLKNYMSEDEAKGVIKCRDCGSKNLVFAEKCFTCLDCGSSKCG